MLVFLLDSASFVGSVFFPCFSYSVQLSEMNCKEEGCVRDLWNKNGLLVFAYLPGLLFSVLFCPLKIPY